MASDDSILAAVSGITSGVRDVLVPYLQTRYSTREKLRAAKELALAEREAGKITVGPELSEDLNLKVGSPYDPKELEILAGTRKKPTLSSNLVDVDERTAGLLGLPGAGKVHPSVISAFGQMRRQEFSTEAKTKATAKKAEEKAEGAKKTPLFVISEIDRILPLNKKSSGGFFGGLRQKTMGALDIEDEKFRNTEDVVNSARSMVAQVLKSTFGGQLSDGERKYLNSVYGAMPGYGRAQRRIALTNIKRMMQSKISETESRPAKIDFEPEE